MTRVELLTTGRLEHAALHFVLGRLFPEARFVPHAVRIDGFTSKRVFATDAAIAGGKADVCIERLAAAVMRGGDADFAILVDDLEVPNIGNASAVMGVFAAAAARIAGRGPGTRRSLRDRCSVHLLAPMPEAYFFALPPRGVLDRAGVPDARVVSTAAGDPEHFYTSDATYLASQRAPGKLGPRDLHAPCVHPKRYLEYLTSEYRETTQGVAALSAVDWHALLASPGEACFFRSLCFDVADMLGAEYPVGRCEPATWGTPTALRNV